MSDVDCSFSLTFTISVRAGYTRSGNRLLVTGISAGIDENALVLCVCADIKLYVLVDPDRDAGHPQPVTGSHPQPVTGSMCTCPNGLCTFNSTTFWL